MNLSVVIIAYNEEAVIEKCLQSISGWTDEIIVVDSHSSDKTAQLAEQYGAQVFQREFKGFSDQKNWGNEQAKGQYILSLDADEEVSPELKTSILNFIKNNGQVGKFKRLTSYQGSWVKHSGWYPDVQTRLFRKGLAKWNKAKVHERLEIDSNAKVELLKGDLKHYSIPHEGAHLSVIKKYGKLRAEMHKEKGKQLSPFMAKLKRGAQFLSQYFVQLGFLDGKAGFKIARNSGLRYPILLHYQKQEKLSKDSNAIAFMNTTLSWGGGEKWHLENALALKNEGFQVVLICHPKSELKKRAEVEQIPIRTLSLSKSSYLNPLKKMALGKILTDIKADRVIMNGSTDLKLAAPVAFKLGMRKIIYRRGLAKEPNPSYRNKKIAHICCTDIICNSLETQSLIQKSWQFKEGDKKLHVLYNSVPVTNVITQNKEEKLILVNASRFSAQKGHQYLIEVAEILKSKDLDFKILLAGKGELESKLKAEVQQKGLQDIIEFVGFQNDVASFLAQGHLYIGTSIYEGFGFSMAESQLQKVPVVCFDSSSNPEVVKDGVGGVLVPSFDCNKMAEEIIALAQNKERLTSLGDKGREFILNSFSFEKQLSLLKAILE